GSIIPNSELLEAIDKLKEGQVLLKDQLLIAANLNEFAANEFDAANFSMYSPVYFSGGFTKLGFPEDIFRYNDEQISEDFKLVTKNRVSAPLRSRNHLIGDQIFIEEGVEAECSNFNTLKGPIYLGKNSEVWEGSSIRGSLALCHNSQLK